MKKLLLKSMLLLCALVVGGTSSVWAGTYSLTPNQASTGSTATTYITTLTEFEYGGISWKMNYWNPNSLQVKVNQTSAASEFRFYNTSEFPGRITQVVITFSAMTVTDATKFMFLGGSEEQNGTTGGTAGTWNATNKTLTWTPGNSDNFTYFAFYQNGKAASGTDNLATSNAIVVTFEGEDIQTCATPTFGTTAGTYTSAQSVTLNSETAGATIRYTLDGTNPTKESTAYSSAIPVSSTTTIKAKAFKSGMASSTVASATYTILGHAGTEADPFTVADARIAIDANTGCTTGVYATGIVSQIVTAYDSGTGKVSFNISTDGQTTSNQLQAYQCITGNADASEVRVGDEVVICGDLTKYQSTYEFASGCALQSLTHATVPIIAATPASRSGFTYLLGNGPSSAKTISITGSNLNESITVTASTNYEISTTEGSGYTNSLSLIPTAGTVDATTIYVRLKANLTSGEYDGTITLTSTGATNVTVNLSGKVIGLASLPFSWTGTASAGSAEFGALTGVNVNLGSDFATSNAPYRLKFDGTTKYVIIYTNEKPEAVSFTAKLFSATTTETGSKIKVQGSADGITFTDIQEFTIKGSQNATFEFTTTESFADNCRAVKLIMSNKDQNVGVGTITVTAQPEPTAPVIDDVNHTVTLTTTANMNGWRTFYPSKADQNYTADADVYYVSETGSSTVTLIKIDGGVPANTPVILHKTSGTTITLTETATSITAPGASNLLAVSTANQNLGKVYRLGYKSSDGVGFYSYTSSSAPAGIIYITPASPAREFLGFAFGDDEATGVNEMKAQKVDGQFYDLQGRKVANPTKGLYIVNGKKVIIK